MKDYEYYYENGTRSTVNTASDLAGTAQSPVPDPALETAGAESPRAKKEKKEKKPFGLKAAAILCASCVLLSGLFG